MYDPTSGVYHGKAASTCPSTAAAGPLPAPPEREDYSMTVHEDAIYVCGGVNTTSMTVLDTCAVLKLDGFLTAGTAPAWEELPVVLGHARNHTSIAVARNKVRPSLVFIR